MSTDMNIDMSDPQALLALFNAAETGGEVEPAAEVKAVETSIPKSAPVVATAPQAEPVHAAASVPVATAAAPVPEKEPDGVATKDGQHIIPYSVLKADRERANRAEQEARELRQQLAAFQAATQAANPATAQTSNHSESGVKDDVFAPHQQSEAAFLADSEELAQLKEDFPTVYKSLMAMQAQVAKQQAQLAPVQESVRNAEQAQQKTVNDQIQEAIDATPKLAHIKATDPEAFELAKQFDNTLKDNPSWSGKPYAERFAKVVELVEQLHGVIVVPGAQTAVFNPATATSKTPEQIKQEARAMASAAVRANPAAVPTSLSEFPAGQSSVSDEQAAIASMSHADLARKFASMSPDKLDAYLQNL